MAKVTYFDRKRSAPYVEFCGVEFTHMQPVEIDETNPDNKFLLDKVRANPFFEVADADAEADLPNHKRKTLTLKAAE